MIKNKKIICLVVARAGSTGLRNKNILKLGGQPLIYWTFRSAKKSKYIDHIMLSTNSKKIIEIAKKNDIDVPFVRPESLSRSNSSLYDVIDHSKKYFSKITKFDYLILLLPTSPFRNYKHIDQALRKFANIRGNDQKTLVSVCKAPKRMNWLLKKKKKNFGELLVKKNANIVNRQFLEELFLPNGAIYICNLKKFKNNFYKSNKLMFYLMNEITSLDIDTKKDFNNAKKYVRYL